MVRELTLGNVNTITVLLIVLLTTSISPFSYATEQVEIDQNIKSEYIEIEVVDDLNLVGNEKEFVFAKSSITDYQAESLNSADILRTIPSINSKDNKILGLVMPPFAYFKTRF